MTSPSTPLPPAAASSLVRRHPSEVAWAFLSSPDVEGGGKIHNVKGDPGGTTKWGFAQRYNPDIDVRDLTYETAYSRFRLQYWNRGHCDELPFQVAVPFVVFAFNADFDDAIPALQRAVYTKVDGVMGPATIKAAWAMYEKYGNKLCNDVLSYQALKYATGNPKFMRGWFVRLFATRAFVERESWL